MSRGGLQAWEAKRVGARLHLYDGNPEIRLEALKSAILAAEHGKPGRITDVLDRTWAFERFQRP